jgi:uncharacterized membrane protein
MDRRARVAGKVIGIAALVVAPLVIHAAIATSTYPNLVVVVSVAQLLILGIIAVIRDHARLKWLGVVAAAAAFAIVWAERSELSLSAMPGLPHALAYSALLFGFGYTLLPDHEAILTRVVNAVRGPLPPDLIVHTRRVTLAWCCFFAAQLIGSVVLYFFAPLVVWSFFINVLNLPLVVLMFLVEGLYRFFRFRNFPMDSLSDIVRVVAKTMEKGSRQADTV